MLLIICLGCGKQGVFQNIPDQLTKEAMECVLTCQSESIECDERCREIGDIVDGKIETADLVDQCYINCDQALLDCYSRCE